MKLRGNKFITINTQSLTCKDNLQRICLVALVGVVTLHYTVEPRYFEVPREMEKKFEIAGFRNNRGSVKFVTMNHFFLIKIQYSMKKDTDHESAQMLLH